jgi:hypothetical protein
MYKIIWIFPSILVTTETLSDKTDQLPETSLPKSSIPTRIKFVRHHSAPLHHRSPIKMRERLMEQQDLEEIRTRIRAYRNDLYKYKSTYSRSPIKRLNTNGDTTLSPFKLPAPQTPVKRYIKTNERTSRIVSDLWTSFFGSNLVSL